jgi:hypothetical protein
MAETAKNTAKTDDAALPGVSFGDDAAPPGVSFGDDAAAPPGVSFGESAASAKPEGWLDWGKRLITEHETAQEKLGQAAAGGMALPFIGAAQAGANVAGASAIEKYLADTARTVKDWASPPELTKGQAELGQTIGSTASLLLAPEAAGALITRIPGVAPAITAAGEYLAPVSKAAGEYLAPVAKTASEYIPESVKGTYRWLRGAAPEAAPAAAEAATAAQKTADLTKTQLALDALRGAITSAPKGAIAGAGLGATEARTEATQEERNSARWDEIRYGSVLGGVLGGTMGAAGGIAQVLKKAWGELSQEEKKKAVEAVQEAINQEQQRLVKETETVVKSRGETIKEASERKAAAEAELTPKQQKIEELAQAGRAAEKRELYEATDAKARDIAGKTNLTKEQAEAFVKEQQRILEASKETAEKQTAEQFAEIKPTSDVELGKAVATPAEKLKADIEAHRKEASGLSKIDEEYKNKGPVFPIKPVIDKINAQIKGVESGLLGSETVNFLTKLKERLENTAKKLGDENKVTLKQLDDARLEIKDAVNNGLIGVSGGVRTAGADLKKLEPVAEGIDAAFAAVDQRYGAALKNYGVLSKELAPFEQKKGVFAGTTEKYYGGPNEMLPRDIALQVLDRTRGGGEGLKTLIKANPELKNTFREYLHGELFGASQESARDVTAKALDEFRKKNAEVLKSTGLTEEFADLTAARRANEQTIKNAETRLAEAEKLKSETGKRLSLEERRREFETGELKRAAAPHEKTVEEAASEMKKAAGQQKIIQKSLAQLETATEPKDVLSKSKELASTLYDQAQERMSYEEYKTVLKKLDSLEQEFERTGNDLKFIKDTRATIASFVARASASAAGGTVPAYGLWRFLRGRDH